MRKVITALLAAAFVVALGAPAFADSARKPSDHRITAMRDHGGRDRDWGRHGDRDDRGYRHGYYRHYYGYPYYDRGPTYSRCRWAYYNDPYFFDRYCRGSYGYGYYRPYAVESAPDQAGAEHHDTAPT